MYVPDSHLVQDEDEEGTPARYHQEGRRSRRPSQSRRESQGESDTFFQRRPNQSSHVLITTTKVCTQELPLPDGVEVRIIFFCRILSFLFCEKRKIGRYEYFDGT